VGKNKSNRNYSLKVGTLRASANKRDLKGEGHEGQVTNKSEEEEPFFASQSAHWLASR